MNTKSPSSTSTPTPIRVLIADDQALIRRGMSLILSAEPDIEVVGQAADGIEALELVRTLNPDVVLMDLNMPRMTGVVATRQITAEMPATRVMVLTTFDTDELVFDAIRAGAQAYLLKDASEQEVLDTVRAVHRGESRMNPHIAGKVMEQFRQMANRPGAELGSGASELPPMAMPGAPAPAAAPGAGDAAAGDATTSNALLSDKEARVLELIAQGMSNRQIANTVFLAEGTVKNYVSRIMEKLHANTRTELAVMTLKQRQR